MGACAKVILIHVGLVVVLVIAEGPQGDEVKIIKR